MTKMFIIWDAANDGHAPRTDDDGIIVSDGVVGRIGEDNAYLTTYGEYPGEKRGRDLEVGGSIKGVRYSLSGSSGVYDIYRVK